MECLVDSDRGIYIPQYFAQRLAAQFSNIDLEDIEILESGPDNEFYWESWETVLDNAWMKREGITYRLHQDMDLFLVEESELENLESHNQLLGY